MTALRIYRDDGLLARWIDEKIGALAARRPHREQARLAWTVPPLLRLAEYGFLIALTALADPDALPLCFAFLSVLAFHHYETVYRLRHQHVPPPSWLRALGGGWDGRVLVAVVLATVGVLGSALLAASVVLGLVYLGESVASWMQFGGGPGAALDEPGDDAGELE